MDIVFFDEYYIESSYRQGSFKFSMERAEESAWRLRECINAFFPVVSRKYILAFFFFFFELFQSRYSHSCVSMVYNLSLKAEWMSGCGLSWDSWSRFHAFLGFASLRVVPPARVAEKLVNQLLNCHSLQAGLLMFAQLLTATEAE